MRRQKKNNSREYALTFNYYKFRLLILLLIIILVSAVFSLANDKFFSALNFQITSRYLVEIGLIAISMTMIIIIRGIDISTGSIVGLCSVIFGFSWQLFHIPLWLSAILAILVGVGCGFFNGFVITRIKIPDLVVTLATMAIFRGIAVGLAGPERVYLGDVQSLQYLGSEVIFGIPVSLYLLIPMVLIGGFVLSNSVFGRQIYMIGNNEIAARFAGIDVKRVRLISYILSGLLCGIAAVIYCARISTAKSNAGLGMEFDVITGVVLGGTSLAGGEGTIWGSMLGLILVIILKNGLNMVGVPSYYQSIIVGIILIATVLFNENYRRVHENE